MTAFGFLLPTREIVMNRTFPTFVRSLISQNTRKRWDLTRSGSVIACWHVRGSRR